MLVGLFQLARRGGQTDVDGVGVALQHLGPAAPGGAVALVDDDDAEGILAVMLGKKAGEILVFIIQARASDRWRYGCGHCCAALSPRSVLTMRALSPKAALSLV